MIDRPTTPCCTVDDCATTIGLVWLRIDATTLAPLGLASTEPAIARLVCTRHYLLAMSEVLTRAGLPRHDPVVVPPSPQRDPALIPKR